MSCFTSLGHFEFHGFLDLARVRLFAAAVFCRIVSAIVCRVSGLDSAHCRKQASNATLEGSTSKIFTASVIRLVVAQFLVSSGDMLAANDLTGAGEVCEVFLCSFYLFI